MQKSKIKSQKYILKLISNKRQKLFLFEFIFVVFISAFYLFNLPPIYARSLYPIRELDGCRNSKECRYYCEIPANKAACWSYDKYVLNKNILGDSTLSITYPITELGNCASAAECFQYCQKAENLLPCMDYAKKMGFGNASPSVSPTTSQNIIDKAKTELGCDSKEACLAFCNKEENQSLCREFAIKNGLNKTSPEKHNASMAKEVKIAASTELGCNDEASCMQYCNQPENKQTCFEFAKKHNLLKSPPPMDNNTKANLLLEAKANLGCNSQEECALFCEKKENTEKCLTLAKKQQISKEGKASTQENHRATNPQGINPLTQQATTPQLIENLKPKEMEGCATQAECRALCEKNPEKCPGFLEVHPSTQPNTGNNIGNPSITPNSNHNEIPPLSFPTITTTNTPVITNTPQI